MYEQTKMCSETSCQGSFLSDHRCAPIDHKVSAQVTVLYSGVSRYCIIKCV